MLKKIAFFNHKGGVSKTTTTFNVGWKLAEKGYKVIVVDADPQCNLTGLILGYKKYKDIDEFYKNEANKNIKDALAPAFESMPKLIEGIDPVEVEGREGMYLLPGHIGLAEYDVTLGIAQTLSGSIQTLKNLPGSINYLLEKTAEKINADYILIDMSPSLSSINQNLLMISNYFIVPTSPDYYSVMALDSLATILKKWSEWSKSAQGMAILKDAIYPYPDVTPKFLGVVIQKFRLKNGKASKGFRYWIDEVNTTIKERLIPELNALNMSFSNEEYYNKGLSDSYCLSEIPDFNTLIATSQEEQTPVFALNDTQLKLVGNVLGNTKVKVKEFDGIFEEIANKIIGLTENE